MKVLCVAAVGMLMALAVPAAADPVYVDPDPMNPSFWVYGATTTRNPENVTIAAASEGYLIAWEAPHETDGHTLLEYQVTRVRLTANVPDVPDPFDLPVMQVGIVPSSTPNLEYTDTTAHPDIEYAYFVQAKYAEGLLVLETHSIASNVVSSLDVKMGYPHCSVAGVSTHWPYIHTHHQCMLPPPV